MVEIYEAEMKKSDKETQRLRQILLLLLELQSITGSHDDKV